jgi:hypothetical protein
MKRKQTLLFALLPILALLWFIYQRSGTPKRAMNETLAGAFVASKSVTPSVPGTPQEAPRTAQRQAVKFIESAYGARIEFYGNAQDQDGQPIAGAKVQYSALEKFWEPGTKYESITDGNGAFSITNIRGAALSVRISKEGYDSIYNRSNGSFAFGVPYDSQRDRPAPTKDHPAIFVLRRKFVAEPLFVVDRDILLSKDGSPTEVSLRSGKVVEANRGDIKIECWTFDQTRDAGGHYEWRARLSVPGGGLVERNETELAFEAPEDGYRPVLDIRTPQTSARWRRDHDSQYWLKLKDGTYSRMRFRITTGGGHFATISAYTNPSGSRNLEFDKSKIAR